MVASLKIPSGKMWGKQEFLAGRSWTASSLAISRSSPGTTGGTTGGDWFALTTIGWPRMRGPSSSAAIGPRWWLLDSYWLVRVEEAGLVRLGLVRGGKWLWRRAVRGTSGL